MREYYLSISLARNVRLTPFETAVMQEYIGAPKPSTVNAAALPAFHMMGVTQQLFSPIAGLTTIAVYRPTSYHDGTKAPVIANPQNALEAIQFTKSNGTIVVPTFLEEWATSPQAVDVLRSLSSVVCLQLS